MNRASLLGLISLAFTVPAVAQTVDHSSMPGMTMPAAPGAAAAAEPDAHAGHDMSMADRGDAAIPKTPSLARQKEHMADRLFDPSAMAAARDVLSDEHGGTPLSKVMGNLLENQARSGGADGYRWDGEAWFGGDINRLVFKSEGEATRGEGVEDAELQALYSRAIGVYTDVQIGVRQDIEPAHRTYATLGVESLLPYWFEAEAALFLSTKGELLARAGGTYDLRLANRLILQPRVELDFAAQSSRETQTGSGLSNAELGIRLRYEFRREFAPYIGVSHDRTFGRTADYARMMGKGRGTTSFVVGIRAWF